MSTDTSSLVRRRSSRIAASSSAVVNETEAAASVAMHANNTTDNGEGKTKSEKSKGAAKRKEIDHLVSEAADKLWKKARGARGAKSKKVIDGTATNNNDDTVSAATPTPVGDDAPLSRRSSSRSNLERKKSIVKPAADPLAEEGSDDDDTNSDHESAATPAAATAATAAASSSSSSSSSSSKQKTSSKKKGGGVAGAALYELTQNKLPAVSGAHVSIMSWNVAGLRACVKKGFEEYVKEQDPDILCLGEVKAEESDIDTKLLTGYHRYWNASTSKKGYSGTAVFTKSKPISAAYGIGIAKHDDEGRVITLEYDTFYLVNTYVPNSSAGLKRLSYRVNSWDVDFQSYITKLQARKPVCVTGDLNVAHHDIDIHSPKTNLKSAGFTLEERASFTKWLDAGWVDVYRHLYPDAGYTYWTSRFNCRATNSGWRLDYFVLSSSLLSRVKAMRIESEVSTAGIRRSDHAPIVLYLSPAAVTKARS